MPEWKMVEHALPKLSEKVIVLIWNSKVNKVRASDGYRMKNKSEEGYFWVYDHWSRENEVVFMWTEIPEFGKSYA